MPGKASPELVYRNGEPVSVILDIAKYEAMLERLEDLDDLEALRKMRERPLRFQSLDEFLPAGR
jgi:hypothetical protein